MTVKNKNYFLGNKASIISDYIGSYLNELNINMSEYIQKDGEYIINEFNSGDSINFLIQLGDS